MSPQEQWIVRVQALLEWATAVCLGAKKSDVVHACTMAYERLESVLESKESIDLLVERIVSTWYIFYGLVWFGFD